MKILINLILLVVIIVVVILLVKKPDFLINPEKTNAAADGFDDESSHRVPRTFWLIVRLTAPLGRRTVFTSD